MLSKFWRHFTEMDAAYLVNKFYLHDRDYFVILSEILWYDHNVNEK